MLAYALQAAHRWWLLDHSLLAPTNRSELAHLLIGAIGGVLIVMVGSGWTLLGVGGSITAALLIHHLTQSSMFLVQLASSPTAYFAGALFIALGISRLISGRHVPISALDSAD